MKKIAVIFGGVSAEHEVSIITGLQVLEQIDRDKYDPYCIVLGKDGLFRHQPRVKKRKDFKIDKGSIINFGKDESGGYFVESRPLAKKNRIESAYLALHGGNGESGQVQGFLDTLGIPYTSPDVEASATTMNKVMTKQVLSDTGINVVPGISVFSKDIKENIDNVMATIKKSISVPVIVKPVHLGSSIGINIARTEIELKKHLLEASHSDSEVLVEKLLSGFTEYNCAVRRRGDEVETSEIERPINHDEILSFADKYQRGGNKKQSGMASLNRELPAKISQILKSRIEETAIEAFEACRCKGMVRIDFMVTSSGKVYLTEINPIPGSMSYYLWEASGYTFTQQITDLIEQSILDWHEKTSLDLSYETDIVEKFVKSQ
jgi:D-alanine-D-alanine ligase